MITNGTERQQRAKLEQIGQSDRAGPLFTSEALGVAKPDPRTFHRVCAALGLAPEQVLHVGDDHALDVVAIADADTDDAPSTDTPPQTGPQWRVSSRTHRLRR